MIIKCTACGYRKNVMESDLMDSDACELCGGAMLFDHSEEFKAELKEAEEGNQNESAGIKENIENQLVTRMIMEIEQYGEAGEWERINTMDLESRLLVMEIFIEAKQRIIEGLK